MILVRDIFQVKFGKMREASQLWQEGKNIVGNTMPQQPRILTDLTGQYYTLVMESQYNDLSEFEKLLHTETGSNEWRNWYQKFTPLVESGRREIFNIVE